MTPHFQSFCYAAWGLAGLALTIALGIVIRELLRDEEPKRPRDSADWWKDCDP